MTRVVAQILHRPKRVSVIWSEGAASFEPYHLEGLTLDAFYDVAHKARKRLSAAVSTPSHDAAVDLAHLGHQLYRLMFQLDAPSPAAQAVHSWWEQIQAKGVTSLELATDMPGRVPWNLVYDRSPEGEALRAAPGSPAWEHFWGFQYALAVGRRVSPHRVFPYFENPSLVVAVDPGIEAKLTGDQRQQLEAFQTSTGGTIVRSVDGLVAALRSQAPDVLAVFSEVERGQIVLGGQAANLRDLRDALAECESGNPSPLVLLFGNGAPETASSWECFLGAATSELSSVLAPEVPGTSALNMRAGLTWLSSFFSAKADAATSLQQARREAGIAGLAYSAFCPPYVRVLAEGAEPAADVPSPALQELPAQPYRPLTPFDREDRALFIGREEETVRFTRLLDEAGARGIFLHGPAGAGKASFLRAGVLPYLETEAVGYLALRDRSDTARTQAEADYPTLALRAGSDPGGQLTAALEAFCAQPLTYGTPAGGAVAVDLPGMLQRLVHGSAQAGNDASALGRLLDDITRQLPFELVIILEQGEDLVEPLNDDDTIRRRRQALAMLASLATTSARCKVILSLRTEFFGQLSEAFASGKDRAGWRESYLAPLNAMALTDALLLPTATEPPVYASAAPRTQYRFAFGPGVVEKLVADAVALADEQRVSAQVLAQAAAGYLVERALERKEPQITLDHLRDLQTVRRGKIELALERAVERRVSRLPIGRVAQQSLRLLMQKLVRRRADGTVTRPLVPVRKLAPRWRGGDTLENTVNAAADAGLLEVQQLHEGGREALYVGLAHDGLAAWAARQTEQRQRQDFARTKVVDVLYIMVPLMVLAVAVTFYLMRSGSRDQSEEHEALKEHLTKKVQPLVNQMRAEAKAVSVPLYSGALAQAEQALQAGNLLRARQHLLSQQPFAGMEEDVTDRRDFAWHYLWRRANPARHTLLGHRGLVHAVAASPDNALLATAGADGTVRLWNLKRQSELAAVLTGHQGPVHAVVFAPDGKSLASAGDDSVIHIWNVTIGLEKPATVEQANKLLAGHTGAVTALAYGKDANTLISGGADKLMLVWDIQKGLPQATLKDHAESLTAIASAPGGNRFASGSADGTMIVWAIDGSKKSATVKLAGPIAGLALSADGATLATASNETQAGVAVGALRVWDADNGKEIAPPVFQGTGLYGVAFKPNSTIVVAVGKDNALRAWDYKTSREQLVLRGQFGWVRSIAFTPDGATVASSSYDNTVQVWDGTSPSDVLTHGDWVQALAISNDDQLLASGGRSGVVKVWRASTGELLTEIKAGAPVTAIGFVPDTKDQQLIVGIWSETGADSVKRWDLAFALGKLHAREGPAFKGHTKGVQCLTFGKNQLLATGGDDGSVILWNVATGESQRKLDADGSVTAITLSPSGARLAIGDRAGVVRAWETATGKRIEQGQINQIHVHHGPVHALALLRDDLGFLSAGGDHLVMQWNWGKDPTLVSRAHHQPVGCLALLGGKSFASGGWDGTVKLWDLRDATAGEECFTLVGHTGPVRALAASASRQLLASGGHDGTIRLWRASATMANVK